ncbi:hypothetical protein FKP32DRAFT_1583696, partial [Trametes sanguinea]
LFDWLRMLYASMQYTVRHNNELSAAFTAAMGILIGDPASPILWLLYISDFELDPHPDDVQFSGRPVSHLEQADDVALISLSAQGMQLKLDQFERYCDSIFVLINTIKTLAAVHGPLPDPLPCLTLHGVRLRYVPTATYVGMTVSSTTHDIFTPHYAAKAQTATRAANATMSLASYTGPLPPTVALQLYRSHVDPHLTAGCEVALDVRSTALNDLLPIQSTFLRRALNVSRRAQLPPLYTETGIWPLQYRRFHLALRFLHYVLVTAPPLPLAAFHELWALSCTRQAPTWWTDLCLVGAALPVPVHIDPTVLPSADLVLALLPVLAASLATHLRLSVLQSKRLPVLQHRILRAAPLPSATLDFKAICAARPFLSLPRRRQREAMTLLLFSEHPLAVEQLRRAPASTPIPRAWRVCRFCAVRTSVEDEEHVLLLCPADGPRALRERFTAELLVAYPPLHRLLCRLPPAAVLDVLITSADPGPLPLFADYVADLFMLCSSTPLLIVSSEAAFRALPPS